MLLSVFFTRRHLTRAHRHVNSAVYDPKSSSNEEDSEALFRSFSEAAELHPSDSTTVSKYIIATKRHSVSASNDQDLRAFIDLDMGVVARERSAYLNYASQVKESGNGYASLFILSLFAARCSTSLQDLCSRCFSSCKHCCDIPQRTSTSFIYHRML